MDAIKPQVLAREALEAYVRHRQRLQTEPFGYAAACFVSYHDAAGQLRGCIGTLAPSKPDLADEVVANAISAAVRDPRFLPIAPEELDGLQVEVSVLGQMEQVSDASALDVKRYGVVVQSGAKRGVLLPDLEGIESVAQQIDIAKRKAGIGVGEPIHLERFEVIKYG